MIRKTLFAVIALALVVFIAVQVFDMNRRVEVRPVIDAIPTDAIALAKSNDFRSLWQRLSETNLMWQALMESPQVSRMDANGRYLDSLFASNAIFGEVLSNSPLWASIHRHAGHKTAVFYAFESHNEDITLPLIWKELGLLPEKREYGADVLYYLNLEAYPDDKLVVARVDGLTLLSFQGELIERSIDQLRNSRSLIQDPAFLRAYETSGEYVDANVFVNYSAISSLIRANLRSPWNERFSGMEDLASWSALDVSLKPNALMLNGFTSISDSAVQYLSCFQGQKEQDLDVYSILPENTSAFLANGISNFSRFREAYRIHLKALGKEADYQNWVDDLNDKYQVDVDAEFTAGLGNEFGWFMTSDGSDRKFVFARSANPTATREFLSKIGSWDEEKSMGKLNVDKFSSQYFGSGYHLEGDLFYTFIESYVVLSSGTDGLIELSNQFGQQKLLVKNDNFVHFADNLSGQSSQLFYANFSKIYDRMQDCLHPELAKDVSTHEGLFDKFENVAFQLTSGKNNLFYQTAYCNYNPTVKKESNSLWETPLDTTVMGIPHIVINHYTNSKEIFVQDSSNQTYLIDNKGNILWKKQVEGPIFGDVRQIDVYKNNKLQLLFNTSTHLHLIDRKGRDVKGFPVKLPSPASTALTLIDYDKDRNYRILIPTENRQILNFGAEGKRIKGWKFKKTKGLVDNPLKYFAVDDRDYLVAVDRSGRIYVLNRKGEERLNIKERLPNSKNQPFFVEVRRSVDECRLVSMDSLGHVVRVSLSDHRENIPLDLGEKVYFEYRDINNDKTYEYVVMQASSVNVINEGKTTLFTIPAGDQFKKPFKYYSTIGKYGKIGLVDSENEEIYLYYDAGGLGREFPLKGHTDFAIEDINADGRNEVIVGFHQSVVTYSLRR